MLSPRTVCGRRPHSLGESRLVSRWRVAWRVTQASLFWILISDPGAFLMERKMLQGIKRRAETAAAESPLESQLGSGR